MPGSTHAMTLRRPHPGRLGGRALAAAGAFLLLAGVRATAAPAGCDAFVREDLASNRRTGWSRVIVTTDGALTAAQQDTLSLLGVRIVRHYSLVRGFACEVPRRNLRSLLNVPFVKHVSADVKVHKTDDYSVPATGADIAYGQYKLDGSGLAVAVIDSGVVNTTKLHKDLRNARGVSRVVVSRNFATGQSSTSDGCGHGTHVAGIIAGNAISSTGKTYTRTLPGIARNVNIVNLRVLDSNGAGFVSDVIAAIQWAVNNRAAYKIRVINLSLGHVPGDYYANDPLCQAVEEAWQAGIVVVCAAGNGGRLNSTTTAGLDNEGYGTAYGTIHSPGNSPRVITVGAMKQDPGAPGVRAANLIATYSSRGPSRLDFVLKPDLVAPGNRIISTRSYVSVLETRHGTTNVLPLSAYSTSKTGTSAYFTLSGSSMATPVAAGAAALLLQANPALTPDTVKARLMMSADKWTFPDGSADACTFGAGYLNIPAALSSTVVATEPALSPVIQRDGSGNLILDPALWGDKAIWGTGQWDARAIWGDKAIWGVNILATMPGAYQCPAWESKAIWGDGTTAVDLTTRVIQGD